MRKYYLLVLIAASSYAKIASFNGRKSWKNQNSYNSVESNPWLAPYKYQSYPPPIPLWAAGKPRRKFMAYFGKDYTTTAKPTTPPTTTTNRPASSSCQHLPSHCWSSPASLPIPLECIDICSLDSPSTLQPVLSSCSAFSSGNLPLQCIEVIQTLLRRQSPTRKLSKRDRYKWIVKRSLAPTPLDG